ncbi:MAG: hypothetical protein V1823_04855 [Chloroflexota bacterium]
MNLGDEGLGEGVKDLMMQVACQHCGERFETPDIKVISHEENVWFLKASCQSCRKASLTVAFIGEVAQPRISGLARAEKRKFKHYPVASSDDLLDMHRFLKDFDGDFARLFGEKSGGDH